MFTRRKTLLFLGAHPDDIPLGAGATIAKLIKNHDIHCYTLSRNTERNGQENMPKEDRAALRVLGVPDKNIHILDFKTRHFPRDRQEICDMLWKLKKELNPEIIFSHSENDVHQDHDVMMKETKRMFRDKTVLGMEVARSQEGFRPQLYIEISRKELDKKIAALKKYTTYRNKHFLKPEVVEAVAISHGVQLELPYVEAFEIIRYVTD